MFHSKAWKETFAMPRRPRDQLFNRNDFNRLIDSARAKGLPIARIDATRDGLSLFVGEPVKDAGDKATGNPWDEVLTNAANEKRAS
jgi:hypothetical protein